ncbi:hypothetical protein [Microbacterium luticocti]|uniref:hypothetical protein n=1 Tax=Microbacterium luticocti TaxID=451764 RepID=UPI00040B4AC6|nr:hypothetical protein [Microbacterium luticocti]
MTAIDNGFPTTHGAAATQRPSAKLPRSARKVAAVALAAVVILAGTAAADKAQAEQDGRAQTQVAAANAQALVIGHDRMQTLESAAFLRVKAARELVAARTAFDAAAATAEGTLGAAKGKVDVAAERTRLAAIRRAATAAVDAAAVTTQTAAAGALTSAVKAKIRAYDAAHARTAASTRAAQTAQVYTAAPATSGAGAAKSATAKRATATASTKSTAKSAKSPAKAPAPKAKASSSGGWFAQMRSILTQVGGGGIRLVQYNGVCAGGRAVACSTQGTIKVSSAIASWTHARKVWAMTHELAHQYQFRVWGKLMASKTYRSLFGGNIELLANCMASARGATAHGMHCSAKQISWARNIWSGRIVG